MCYILYIYAYIYEYIHICTYIHIYLLSSGFKIRYTKSKPIGVKNLVECCQVLLSGAFRPKLCGNCAFPQNFHTRKLGEITGFSQWSS